MIHISVSEKEWISLTSAEDSFRFVKLCDNFSFVESSASSSAFDEMRGDGKKNIYIALSAEDRTLVIYSIDISIDVPQSEFVSNVQILDTETNKMTSMITCYGSELSSKGIMWLAIFDRNMVLGFDLVTKTVKHQFNCIPCPNDLAICSKDEDIIYVAGGRGLNKDGEQLSAVIPPLGSVSKLNAVTKSVETIWETDELHSLAGIIHMNNEIQIAQLFEMRALNLDYAVVKVDRSSSCCDCSTGMKTRDGSIITWQGTDVGNGEDTFLIDNLDYFEDKYIIGAIYRSMKTSQVSAMKNSFITVVGWSVAKLITCLYNAFTGVSSSSNTLNNAELLLQFSTKDKFDDLCFVLCDPKTRVNKHFQYPNITQAAKSLGGVNFDGHITDTSYHGGKFCFVNFKSNHVLIMNDHVVKAALG